MTRRRADVRERERAEATGWRSAANSQGAPPCERTISARCRAPPWITTPGDRRGEDEPGEHHLGRRTRRGSSRPRPTRHATARKSAIAATRSKAPSRSAPTTCGPSANVPTSTDASAEPIARGPRPNSASSADLEPRCAKAASDAELERRRDGRRGEDEEEESGEREPDDEQRWAVLDGDALAGVADHRDGLGLLGPRVAVAKRDLRGASGGGRDVGDLADVHAVDGADDDRRAWKPARSPGDPGTIFSIGSPRGVGAPGVIAEEREDARPFGRARLDDAGAHRGRASTSRVRPCIMPTSGGAPGALDANATSTSTGHRRVHGVIAVTAEALLERLADDDLDAIRAGSHDAVGLDGRARATGGRPGRSSVPAEGHAGRASLREARARGARPDRPPRFRAARAPSPRREAEHRPSRTRRGRGSQRPGERGGGAEHSNETIDIEEVP